MDISTSYKQHRHILKLQDEIAEVVKEIWITEWAYRLAFVATFVVYFVFVWMMYVSDLWGFTSWLVDNLSEVAALIIYTVLAITLPLSMALIKEIGYKHFAKYPNPKAAVLSIVGILAFAGVVYESISSSSQQQHISTSAAEKSKTFDVITNSSTGTINTASMGALIAEAQKQLARCEEKLKDGREPHCEGDKAKLQGYLDSEQRAMDSAERAATAAIETKTKALKELKEESYKPAFKAIRDSFDVTISTGVMIVTTFISIIFEISHLLLILFLSQKLRRKDWLMQSLISLEAAYLNSTGKAFKPEDFADDSVLNMQDVREQSPSPIGFGSPAIAQFKYQQKKPFAGFVNTNGSHPKTGETIRDYPADQTGTWNAGLSKSGINSPADDAMNQTADKAQIERIIERGQQSQEPTSQLSMLSQTSDLDSSLQAVSDGLYPAWRKAVKSGECSHAKAATQKFIWKHAGDEIQTLTANEVVRIWNCWKVRGANDGLLKANPKYSPGNRKPEFVLA